MKEIIQSVYMVKSTEVLLDEDEMVFLLKKPKNALMLEEDFVVVVSLIFLEKDRDYKITLSFRKDDEADILFEIDADIIISSASKAKWDNGFIAAFSVNKKDFKQEVGNYNVNVTLFTDESEFAEQSMIFPIVSNKEVGNHG